MKMLTIPNNSKKCLVLLVPCPKCTFLYPEGFGASSREFEETEVCSRCGHIEGIEDYEAIIRAGKRKYSY